MQVRGIIFEQNKMNYKHITIVVGILLGLTVVFKIGLQRYRYGSENDMDYADKFIEPEYPDIVDHIIYKNCTEETAEGAEEIEEEEVLYDRDAVQERRQQHIEYICAKKTLVDGNCGFTSFRYPCKSTCINNKSSKLIWLSLFSRLLSH